MREERMTVKVLQGVSGSGKTSHWQRHLNWNESSLIHVFSSDHHFTTPKGYIFVPTQLNEAHAECLRKFAECIRTAAKNALLIVDNTNTTVHEIAPYYCLAEAYGHDVEILTIEYHWPTAAARNKHSVPAESVEKQYRRLKNSHQVMPKYWRRTDIIGKDS